MEKNSVIGDIMEEKEKTEEKPKKEERRPVRVKVLCGIPSGWSIPDARYGRKRILQGEKVEFNIYDRVELHGLLQVLKTVNTPRINEVEYVKSRNPARHGIRKKFEIVGELPTEIPKVLQEIRYGRYKTTPEEEDAILTLVPNYFEKVHKTVKIVT